MKMIRKYTNMAFLLLSIASIVHTYGNEATINENQDKQEIVVETKKTEKIAWYNKKIGNTQADIAGIAGYISFLASVSALLWYTELWKGIIPVKQQEHQAHNSIIGVTVLGTITQTDGNNTTIITPGKKPIWVKQDSAGTWIKNNASSPWVLYDSNHYLE